MLSLWIVRVNSGHEVPLCSYVGIRLRRLVGIHILGSQSIMFKKYKYKKNRTN